MYGFSVYSFYPVRLSQHVGLKAKKPGSVISLQLWQLKYNRKVTELLTRNVENQHFITEIFSNESTKEKKYFVYCSSLFWV